MQRLVSIVSPTGQMCDGKKLLQPLDAVLECVVRVVSLHERKYAACVLAFVKHFKQHLAAGTKQTAHLVPDRVVGCKVYASALQQRGCYIGVCVEANVPAFLLQNTGIHLIAYNPIKHMMSSLWSMTLKCIK